MPLCYRSNITPPPQAQPKAKSESHSDLKDKLAPAAPDPFEPDDGVPYRCPVLKAKSALRSADLQGRIHHHENSFDQVPKPNRQDIPPIQTAMKKPKQRNVRRRGF